MSTALETCPREGERLFCRFSNLHAAFLDEVSRLSAEHMAQVHLGWGGVGWGGGGRGGQGGVRVAVG